VQRAHSISLLIFSEVKSREGIEKELDCMLHSGFYPLFQHGQLVKFDPVFINQESDSRIKIVPLFDETLDRLNPALIHTKTRVSLRFADSND